MATITTTTMTVEKIWINFRNLSENHSRYMLRRRKSLHSCEHG
jgi:hypothetical protein